MFWRHPKPHYRDMTLSPEMTLSDREKLETLQRLDQFRKWRSLDDKRYCLCCAKVIDGRLIRVVAGSDGDGSLQLLCPTHGCDSIPMDWVMPTDEVLAKMFEKSVQDAIAQSGGKRETRERAGFLT